MRLKADMLKAFDSQRKDDINLTTLNMLNDRIELVLTDTKKMLLPSNDEVSHALLKRYRLATKNYFGVFHTRAKVLVDLMQQLCSKFEDRLKKTHDFFRKFKKSVKKNLEGVSLTQEVVYSISRLKSFVSDFDTEAKARLEELREMKEQLGRTEDDSAGATGYYGAAVASVHHYLNSLSLMIHKIEKDKQNHHTLAFAFSSADTNPALQERLSLVACDSLRLFAIEVVAVKVFDIQRCVNERIEEGCKIVQSVSTANPESFEAFKLTNVSIRLSSLLESPFRRYVKAKIGLRPEIIVMDQDFKEFFEEKFVFKYPAATPLWVCKVQVHFENPRTKELMPFLLLLDVA